MKRSRLSSVLTAGALSAVLAAAMMLAAPSRTLAQDDDSATIADSKTPPAAMAGTWIGSIVDTSKGGTGSATLTLDLTQVKSTVGGTFSISGAGSPSGSVRGKVKGNKATLKLSVTNKTPPCDVNVKGEVLTLDEYKGTFNVAHASKHCHAKGTFDIFLQ
ncbi:MAG TPA: hypothetical protein VMV27_13270 [Candidatus Binataceae bacterium]|nr:hypothetical protein [Candidatus Binataceae bacterium]